MKKKHKRRKALIVTTINNPDAYSTFQQKIATTIMFKKDDIFLQTTNQYIDMFEIYNMGYFLPHIVIIIMHKHGNRSRL